MKLNVALIVYFILFIFCFVFSSSEELCEARSKDEKRYLLYEVQPGEGFNLRRDVYIRVANLIKKLNEQQKWTLVLPPWGRMYHWVNEKTYKYYPWKTFFDLDSFNRWIPVIEFEEFVSLEGSKVSRAILLQHYEEGWDGKWEEKYEKRPCLGNHNYEELASKQWNNYIWGHDISIKNFSCISFQGQAITIIPLLQTCQFERSVLIDHAEILLHDEYGGQYYWNARRSMRFAKHLVQEASNFRSTYLNSTDAGDNTLSNVDWRDDKVKTRNAIGGPYVGVHLRRRDFVRAREDEVPSLKSAARQIIQILKKHLLKVVFVATDAPDTEFKELVKYLSGYTVYKYIPSQEFLKKWGDGAVAIVDQIICSHARFFTGSYESTFSFRIQEEREILGFPVETTFNRLCGRKSDCNQPAQWKIEY